MKITFTHKKKAVTLKVKNCNTLERIIGLMFTRKEKAKILLFDFHKKTTSPIHSLFVFIAIWLDEKNEIVAIQKVKPWKIKIKQDKPFTKLIEIPISKKYKDIINNNHFLEQ